MKPRRDHDRAKPMSRPLRLTWPHRDRILLGVDDGGSPVWGAAEDLRQRPLEVRETVGRNGGGDPSLLIRGDNLVALRSLEERFAGKIQCTYIDPPFNTGNAFAHYADDLEDELWLGMMEPRLRALRDLLKPEGVIVVHIDHRELAPLKLLLDEVFGKDNFLSLVTVKVKDPAGVGQQSFVFDVCEYLLIYARDLSRFRPLHPLQVAAPVAVQEPVKGYTKAVVDFGTPHFAGTVSRKRVGEIKIYRCSGHRIRRFGKRDSWEDYLLNFDRIFADYNPSGGTILSILDEIPPVTLSYIEYTPSKGKDAGKLSRVYFLNRRIVAWLKDVAGVDARGRILKRSKLTNIWEVSNAQLFAEGGVRFRQGKKPESLIARIISLTTSPGDWVLDSFLGSGTTAAVAHKLGRKWIGIERGEHAETHCLPRLKRVVSGADQAGISKQVKWKGGGSFAYCELGDALLAGKRLRCEALGPPKSSDSETLKL